jgi:hypothetical protein
LKEDGLQGSCLAIDNADYRIEDVLAIHTLLYAGIDMFSLAGYIVIEYFCAIV